MVGQKTVKTAPMKIVHPLSHFATYSPKYPFYTWRETGREIESPNAKHLQKQIQARRLRHIFRIPPLGAG